MGRIHTCLLFVLSTLALCSAFNSLVPNNKELVYRYNAIVKAATAIPTSFTSEVFISGKLHVQRVDSVLKVRFSDLQFNMYNGEVYPNFYINTKQLPVPEELSDLMQPFQIVYDASGAFNSIATSSKEKEFVINIKKAVASIFQMEVERISTGKRHAFITWEPSIYGMHRIAYNVVPLQTVLIVHKAHEMGKYHAHQHMHPYMASNVEHEFCEMPSEVPIAHDYERTYYIVEKDGGRVVQTAHAFGGFAGHPYEGRSDAFFMFSNQTLSLEEMKSIDQPMAGNLDRNDKDLVYMTFDPMMETESIPDVTNGRRQLNIQNQISEIYTMLEEILKYLNKNHIVPQVPDVKQGQLINRIVRFLLYFKRSDLETVYNTLKEGTSDHNKRMMEVYQQLLPLVGTRASMMFIKDLIRNNKVKDYVAIDMLQKLPFNVKVPTVKLLQDMEEMLNWGEEINKDVRNAAVLSFGSLVHKSYNYEKKLYHQSLKRADEAKEDKKDHNPHHTWMEMDTEFFKQHPEFEKYVQEFWAKLKAATDHETQLQYMAAMFNTKLDFVVHLVEPIVTGELSEFSGLRVYSIYAVLPMVVKNPDKVFELYWPILTDRRLSRELRVMAFYAIMESHPSMSTLLNMYWFMQSETDSQLYKIYYDFIKSWSKTTDKCHSIFKDHMSAIAKFSRPPIHHGIEGHYLMDYVSQKYGHGGGFELSYVSTNKTRAIQFSISYQNMGILQIPYSVYIRIDGLDDIGLRKMHLNRESTKEVFNWEEMINLIGNLQNKKDFTVEIALLQQNQMVQMLVYDHTNIKDSWLLSKLLEHEFSITRNVIMINYLAFTTILLPNDMGFPVRIDSLMPSVDNFRLNMVKNGNVMNINNLYKAWRHSWQGMSFYNPIADVWQGIQKFHSYDHAIPLYVDVNANPATNSLKITFHRYNDENRDTMGLRSHAMTMVFVKDDLHTDVLQKTCDWCKKWVEVTKVNKINDTLLDEENTNTGYKEQLMIYDGELGSIGSWEALRNFYLTKRNKNFNGPLGFWILTTRELLADFMLFPMPLTNGYLIRMVPSTKWPVSEIELNLRINREIQYQENVPLPGLKQNSYMSYQAKMVEGSEPLKAMEVNAIMDLQPGHKFFSYKMQISLSGHSLETKRVCIDGNRKATTDQDTGRMTVAVSRSPDGKCTKDDVVVDVSMMGEKTEEQSITTQDYGECVPYMLTTSRNYIPDFYTECTTKNDMFRRYMYNIKYQNMPDWLNQTLVSHLHDINYGSGMKRIEADEGNEKVYVEYPMQREFVRPADVSVFDAHYHFWEEMGMLPKIDRNEYKILRLPITMATYWGLHPTHTRFSYLYQWMYMMGMTQTCRIYHNTVKLNDRTAKMTLSKDWTLYGGDKEQDTTYGYFVKEVGEYMALKIVHGEKNIEIQPVGDKQEHFKIMVNGAVMDNNQRHYSEEWFALSVHSYYVDIFDYEYGVHYLYMRHQILVDIPNHGVQAVGRCFSF